METGHLESAGCDISWCAVGGDDEQAIVLVHGALAHRHWWEPAVQAGLARDGRRVVAFDLSGHGDSGRRPDYSAELWADEALATIEECAGGKAALVGHSMGGLVALIAAARRPDLVSSLVLVDTRILLPGPEEAHIPRGSPAKATRIYPTREAAVESIRLFPPQPVVNAEAVRLVAEHSIGRVGDGWGWKFDPAIAQRFTEETINRNLAAVECPLAMIYGDSSALVDSSSPANAEAIMERRVPATVITGAHHHVILDRPAASAGAISGALASLSLS
jgi:pimeloyl-ACP methyl ester carboxylesterase